MKNILEKLKMPREKGKTYALLYHMTCVIHLIYMAIFIVEKSKLLAQINGVLALFYLIIGFVIVNAVHYGGIFTLCTIAMTVFLIVHYALLGPTFGFQYLCISMVPFMFFLAYINESGVKVAKRGSVASFISLCAVTVACSNISYPLLDISENTRRFMVFFNLALTFFISIRFMTEFVNKAYADAGVLENKNTNLEQSANIDALTGLLNRRTIETRIDRVFYLARGEGKDFSFLMCDIDNFKHINDTYGHDCGDQVLKNIAGIIKKEVRPDDIVYRWGGEEILIIVSGGAYAAKNVAERCRKSIEESTTVYEGTEIKITITIGGSTYYQGATRDDLINKADKNLYEGKKNGKNQVVM